MTPKESLICSIELLEQNPNEEFVMVLFKRDLQAFLTRLDEEKERQRPTQTLVRP